MAVVVDLFSRRVVGWSMSAEMTAQLVTNALVMAMTHCCITPIAVAQYTSEQFQKLMADHGIVCSMSRFGQCLRQCGNGEPLLLAQDRAYGTQDLSDT